MASTSVPYVNTRQRLIRKLVLFAQIEESSPIDISRDEPAFFWYAPQTRNGSGGPHVAAVAAVVAVAAVWYIHGGSRSGRGLHTLFMCHELQFSICANSTTRGEITGPLHIGVAAKGARREKPT